VVELIVINIRVVPLANAMALSIQTQGFGMNIQDTCNLSILDLTMGGGSFFQEIDIK